MSRNSDQDLPRSSGRQNLEDKLRRLSFEAPDPGLRRRTLEAGRRRLATRTDMQQSESLFQGWRFESLLATAVLMLAAVLLSLTFRPVPPNPALLESAATTAVERRQLARVLGTEAFGLIGSTPQTQLAPHPQALSRFDI